MMLANDMLCQNCQQREATVHITSIVDDVAESRDLCKDCCETEVPEWKESVTEALAARCRYCGGQPCASGTDFFARVGLEETKFMCRPCWEEFNRYSTQEFERRFRPEVERLDREFELFPDGVSPSQQEQMAALAELREAADKHMKQWVAQRGSQ